MNRSYQIPKVWQYFMLVLSIGSLALFVIQTYVEADNKISTALSTIDNMICLVFFVDFSWQLIYTKPRIQYLKWGWLDLISSIPIFPEFRIARLARIFRIIRLLRGARATKQILSVIFIHRARNAFAAVVFGSFILLLFSVLAIVTVEPSISTRDAFWWCLFTLMTGEYGDFYPSSTEGRIITGLLMTAGVALFGTFTASVASFFLEEDQKEDERRDADILREIRNLSKEIVEIKKDFRGD